MRPLDWPLPLGQRPGGDWNRLTLPSEVKTRSLTIVVLETDKPGINHLGGFTEIRLFGCRLSKSKKHLAAYFFSIPLFYVYGRCLAMQHVVNKQTQDRERNQVSNIVCPPFAAEKVYHFTYFSTQRQSTY